MRELWRGNANAWECDELGHLNVRAYIAKAMQAAGALADDIGMPRAFQPVAAATLIPTRIHVRYLAEVRPGAPLMIEGGVSEARETGLQAVFMMRDPFRDSLAATLIVDFDHASPDEGRAFAWSPRLREAIEALCVEMPDKAQARGVDSAPPDGHTSLDRARELGLTRIGLGRIGPEDIDLFGRMRAELSMGKISDSAVHMADIFPEELNEAGPPLAGAVLEARIAIARLPRAGEGYQVHSGLIDANETVRRVGHLVFDTARGAPLWSVQAVVCLMDLDARTLARTDPATVERLNARAVRGLKA